MYNDFFEIKNNVRPFISETTVKFSLQNLLQIYYCK